LKEEITERLKSAGAEYVEEELEAVFVPFLDPHIRRIVETFESRARRRGRWQDCSAAKLFSKQKNLHPFDKRRLHYLRCGRVDIGNLDTRAWKFLNVLLEKSRDETEALLGSMEQDLPPYEFRPYLYTALNLQKHFKHHPMLNVPAALDPEKVDQCVVEELCRLNLDDWFFKGVANRQASDTLHPYLVRYVVSYFDNAFDGNTIWNDDFRDFISKRQYYQRAPTLRAHSMAEKEACKRFGISPEKFKMMDRHELIRCYRRLAKKTHPDTGGDKDAFQKAKEAYECLLTKKS
jgi:hypothetical protein